MKQILVLFLIVLFSASSIFAQSEQVDDEEQKIKVDPASKARIKFIEDYYNFGSIPLDAVVVHDFPIKNEGTDTLVITSIKPTCGCTTAPMESNKIAPGEIQNLHVQLNTRKLHGMVRKFINIECNDPINPYMRISFRAVINDPKQVIVPIPNNADFGNVLQGEDKAIKVELKNTAEEDLKLTMLSLPDDNKVAIKPGKMALKSGEATEFDFILSDEVTAGALFSSVTIEAEGKPKTRISIPITGTVVE